MAFTVDAVKAFSGDYSTGGRYSGTSYDLSSEPGSATPTLALDGEVDRRLHMTRTDGELGALRVGDRVWCTVKVTKGGFGQGADQAHGHPDVRISDCHQ
ncbi:hypothetical protein GCM10027167_85250 [Nocardia heshunensis]